MQWRLAKEAGAVGLILVPLYGVVRGSVDNVQFQNERSKDYLAVFMSGMLFHVLAEATGMNDWYIQHGAATQKWLLERNKDVDVDRYSGTPAVCALAVWCSGPAGR